MRRQFFLSTIGSLMALGIVLPGFAPAQLIGARAEAEGSVAATAPPLDRDAIENYITVEGTVERQFEPTALRIVLALLVEGPTASACQEAVRKREAELLTALDEAGIDRSAIVVDFISILPSYSWSLETREDETVAVEKSSGFRLQSNVHVQVPSADDAQLALEAAFKVGVSDVIAFDYWNDQIEQHKREARKEALQVAKEKAELLLAAVFEDNPRPINVQEWTRAIYPRSLYASFESAYSQELTRSFSRTDIARIAVAKPKNTYYRGLLADSDVQGDGLPLRPQISVISTVRLYYATPRRQKMNEADLKSTRKVGLPIFMSFCQ